MSLLHSWWFVFVGAAVLHIGYYGCAVYMFGPDSRWVLVSPGSVDDGFVSASSRGGSYKQLELVYWSRQTCGGLEPGA
jgi:hypothetical protein